MYTVNNQNGSSPCSVKQYIQKIYMQKYTYVQPQCEPHNRCKIELPNRLPNRLNMCNEK